jgi:superoxide dismutase
MRPNGGGAPSGLIAGHIKGSFGDYAKFREEFATAAVTQFGSGWAWLVHDQDKKLKVLKTANAVQLALSPRTASAMDQSFLNGPSPSIEKPNSLGSWLISTVSAIPFM